MNDKSGIFLPTSLEDVFTYVVEFAQRLFAFPAVAFADLTAEECSLQIKLTEPVGKKFISTFKSRILESIRDLSDMALGKEDLKVQQRGSKVDPKIRRILKSYFACPVTVGEKTSAILAFGSNRAGAFSASNIQLVTTLIEHYSNFLAAANASLAELKHMAEMQVAQEKLHTENQLVEKLRKLDEIKSSFMSTVSHELRTPMTAVKSSIQFILDGTVGPVTDEQKKWLDMAMRNIDRLSRLIHDVLEMSRVERGRLKLEFRQLTLRPVAEEAVVSLQNKAAEKGSAVETGEFDSSVEAYFDPDAITQVITNLIANALSHNPSGVHVTVSLTETTDTLATVCVADDGKGIPPEQLERIFDKFIQVEKSLDQSSEGTGLGLAISKGIVEAHRGKIWCESIPGKGSKFKLSLPRTPESVRKIVQHPRLSTGPEILFGKLVVLLSYAEESEVEQCVGYQAVTEDPRSLGELMVDRGILTPEQRDEVLKVQKANLQKPFDNDPVRMLADVILGRLAVKFKYLPQRKVNECVRIQATRHSAGRDCRLGEIFVEKGHLTLSQVLDILALQGITVMSCSDCGVQTNLFYYSPANDYWCFQCGGKLKRLEDHSSETASDK